MPNLSADVEGDRFRFCAGLNETTALRQVHEIICSTFTEASKRIATAYRSGGPDPTEVRQMREDRRRRSIEVTPIELIRLARLPTIHISRLLLSV